LRRYCTALDQLYQELIEAQKLVQVQAQLEVLKAQLEAGSSGTWATAHRTLHNAPPLRPVRRAWNPLSVAFYTQSHPKT
jgi:hypothetical protein